MYIYTAEITETRRTKIEIYADTRKEAEDKAYKMYENGEINLEEDNIADYEIAVEDE